MSLLLHAACPLSVLIQCHVPDGGIVPKSLYMPVHEQQQEPGAGPGEGGGGTADVSPSAAPTDSPFALDGLYLTASVVKDFPHEVAVCVWLYVLQYQLILMRMLYMCLGCCNVYCDY